MDNETAGKELYGADSNRRRRAGRFLQSGRTAFFHVSVFKVTFPGPLLPTIHGIIESTHSTFPVRRTVISQNNVSRFRVSGRCGSAQMIK